MFFFVFFLDISIRKYCQNTDDWTQANGQYALQIVCTSGPTEHQARFGSNTDSIRDLEFSLEEKVA